MRQRLASVILVLLAVVPTSAQWPQWRGPSRDGVVPAASVPASWPEKPTLTWTQAVGEGCSSPVVAGDTLVISGTRKGTFGYRVEKTGATWAPKQFWHNTDLPMYMSTPVADGDFIYGFSSKRKGQIFCLDAKTGTTKWATEGRGGMNAAIQSAGDNLIVLTSEGELIVAKRAPDRYQELRRYKIADSQTWGHPVLLGSQFVIRDADSIAVWSLR